MRTMFGRFGLVIALAMVSVGARADEPRLADYYGFLAPEIYKLEARIGNLTVRDFDGDGIADILVVNNARSRIDLLLSKPKAAAEPEASDEANRIRSDSRMRLVSVPVSKEIVSLQVGDFNGDGKPDLVFYGTPAELIVLANRGDGEFTELGHIMTGDAVESPSALAVGDLNRDGRDDIALVRSEELIIIPQRKEGGLGEPEHLPHTATKPSMVQIADLDGDGGKDLVLLDAAPEDPVRVRFGTADGLLGPEERLALESPRAVSFGDLDGKPGVEMLTIEAKSGRAKVFSLAAPGAKGTEATGPRGRLLVYPLPREGSRGRTLAVGDLDGDKKADVVVTDPNNAQVLVFRQGPGGLATPRTFPSLTGIRAVRATDLDGDGKSEVLVLSDSEKQIGLSRMEKDRLSFPAALPTAGEPVSLDVGDLDGDGTPEVLYAVAAGKDPAGLTFTIKALKRQAAGAFAPVKWGQADAIEVKGLNSAPPAIRVVDANADGKPDLLVFNEYGSPALLLGQPDGPPTLFTGSLGPLANAPASAVALAGRLGPGLIVAQGTYARQVVLDASGRWTIKDQFNAERNDAQIVAASALDLDGGKDPEVALVDRASHAVHWLERRDGSYRAGEPLPIGPLDVQGLVVADFDGDGRDDLLLSGADRFAVILTARPGPSFKQLAAFETGRENAHFGDLVVGDVNGDGHPDVILTDTGEHFVEIAAFRPQPRPSLVRALAFQVYERKAFRDPGRNTEPRELAVGDVDGDKRDDLVLIAHDRVLVYRQDPGPQDKK